MTEYLFDDDDLEDFVRDLEQSFGLRFGQYEFWHCRTLADVHDILQRRIGNGDPNGACPSAMTFYRLRQALLADGVHRSKVRRDTPLATLVGRKPARWRRRLSERSKLAIPAFSLKANGCLLAVFSAAVTALLPFEAHLTIAAALFGLALLLWRLDPGQVPAGLVTFGDLVEAVARRNFGTLLSSGARRMPDDVWASLAAIAKTNAMGGTTTTARPETLLHAAAESQQAA